MHYIFINQLEWTNSYEFPVSVSVQQTDCSALHVTLTFLEEDVVCTVYVRMMLLRHSTATPSSPRTKDPVSQFRYSGWPKFKLKNSWATNSCTRWHENIEILSRRPCNMNFSSGTLGKTLLLPPPKVVRFSEPLRPQFRILNRTGHSLGVRQAWWWWWCFFSAALKNRSNTHGTQQDSDVFFWGCIHWFQNLLFGGNWLHPWNLVILFWSWFHPQPGFQFFKGFTANSSEACGSTSQLVNSGSWSIASIVIWYQISSVSLLYIQKIFPQKIMRKSLSNLSLPTKNKNHLHE